MHESPSENSTQEAKVHIKADDERKYEACEVDEVMISTNKYRAVVLRGVENSLQETEKSLLDLSQQSWRDGVQD